jgi:hypothetical protein
LARSSWVTPTALLTTITRLKSASISWPKIRTNAQSTAMMALKRVSRFARRICPSERLFRRAVALTAPLATRSATSALVSPRRTSQASKPAAESHGRAYGRRTQSGEKTHSHGRRSNPARLIAAGMLVQAAGIALGHCRHRIRRL